MQHLNAILAFDSSHASVKNAQTKFMLDLFKRENKLLTPYDLLTSLAETRLVFAGNDLDELLVTLTRLFPIESSVSVAHCYHPASASLQAILAWLASRNDSEQVDRERISGFIMYMTKHIDLSVRCAAYKALLHVGMQREEQPRELERIINHAMDVESAEGLTHCIPLIALVINSPVGVNLVKRLYQIACHHQVEKVRRAAYDQLFLLASHGSFDAVKLLMSSLTHESMFSQQEHLSHLILNYYDSIANHLECTQKRAFLAKSQTVIECLKTNPAAKRLRQMIEIKFLSYDVISNTSAQQPYHMPESASSLSLAN